MSNILKKTKYLRGSKRFKKIIKLLGDNVETLVFKIHSLLSAIRELYLEAKVRFITGRPRKTEKRLQMKKSTTKKKGCENKFS